MLVLDASASLSWFFDDQANDATWDLLTQVNDSGAIVPSHWALEVTSAILRALRLERTTEAKRHAFVQLLDDLQIELDPLTHSRAGRETLDLARQHELSSYDAAYLDLARRRNLPLATRDKRLAAAARDEGLKTIEP